MKSNLAKILIEKGIIRKGIALEANYTTKGISCTNNVPVKGRFILNGASSIKDWVFFTVIGPNNENLKIRCDQVLSLDGMPIKRVAESHQLDVNGNVFMKRQIPSRYGNYEVDEGEEDD